MYAAHRLLLTVLRQKNLDKTSTMTVQNWDGEELVSIIRYSIFMQALHKAHKMNTQKGGPIYQNLFPNY
jgi:hypothetical protein